MNVYENIDFSPPGIHGLAHKKNITFTPAVKLAQLQSLFLLIKTMQSAI